MQQKETGTFSPPDRQAWRRWLERHHETKQSVWLIFYKKASGVPTIAYSEAVDEALCFGWIDGKAMPVDAEKSMRFFCKRKTGSVWSKVNKDKIKRLTEEKRMTAAGLASVVIAKQNGSWNILDEVEELVIPSDLQHAFTAKKGSFAYFSGLSRSVRKAILHWLVMAKRPETRSKRINEIVTLAAQHKKPHQF